MVMLPSMNLYCLHGCVFKHCNELINLYYNNITVN